MTPEYIFTGERVAPSIITVGAFSTPVWIQQSWQDGEFARFIVNNGCGHCCTAMALNLRGFEINPHEEFELCRKMWGEPRSEEPYLEAPFMSVSGIAKVLKSFGVDAECFGVPKGELGRAREHIKSSLEDGRLVIFSSHPKESFPENPFSPGHHYVLAAGFDKEGRILVANSSTRGKAENGLQFTDIDTIAKALMEGTEPMDFTWGRADLLHTCGYVMISEATQN